VGFVAGAALTAFLGIFIGLLPVLIFLSILMVYDAIAVYWTKHMVSLADVVVDMKLPLLMVMPTEPSFDYAKMGSLKEHTQKVQDNPEEREALFMGLGDAIIPGILVVSSYVFLPTTPAILGIGSNLIVALGAMAGSLVGYAVLMKVVEGGNPQAGLPFLNGGAIAGFFLALFLVFHSLTVGLI
jgi:presenilin-like A22 family membrane protease